MKVIDMINEIEKNQKCSVNKANELTKLAQNENRISKKEIVRFKPFFGVFDIINYDFYENGFDEKYCELQGLCLDELKEKLGF